MSRIVIDNIEAGYGSVRVLHGVSITVEAGETVALLGTNGNGKSTLIKCLMGMVAPTSGSVTLETDDGEKIDLIGKTPQEIVELGIALVPEGRRLFPRLTVEENLMLGAYRESAREHIDANLAFSFEAFPVLADRRRQLAGSMSGGEQQMLALARALMSEPRILLVDEPSVGLAPILVSRMIAKIKELKDRRNLTVLMAEQNFNQAIKIADRGYIIVPRSAASQRPENSGGGTEYKIIGRRGDAGSRRKRRQLIAGNAERPVAKGLDPRDGVVQRHPVLAFVDFDQQHRPVAAQGFRRAGDHFHLESFDIDLDEGHVRESVFVEPFLTDRPALHVLAAHILGFLQRAALVRIPPVAVNRQYQFRLAGGVRQRDLERIDIPRHAARKLGIHFRIGLERLHFGGNPAQQPGIQPLIRADIDGDRTRPHQPVEKVKFAFALFQPPRDEVAQIQPGRHERVFDTLLEREKPGVGTPVLGHGNLLLSRGPRRAAGGLLVP